MTKQYGLFYPKKQGHQIGQVTTRPSIFDEDSDDQDTQDSKPTGLTKGIKKQDKINQVKALEDDPTVYQYDEVYDKMDLKRKESKLSRKDLDRKPKYINKLLAAAEKRKRDNERRIERQVQREREEEGDMYRDKESFVTSAYKKKLEEMRALDEQEEREKYLESIGDVRKQENLDGFYRHLYDQKLNYKDEDEEVKASDVKVKSESESDNGDTRKRKSSESQSETETKIKKVTKTRKYRIRRNSEDNSESDSAIKKEHLPSNLDADSDFSIDSSDSEDEKEKENNTIEVKKEEQTQISLEKIEEKIETIEKLEEIKEEKIEKPKKPKTDIWKKRTVGEIFDQAVKRYFERKALRDMSQKEY